MKDAKVRDYKDYDEYVSHQKEKTERTVKNSNALLDLEQRLAARKQTFRERFEELNRALSENDKAAPILLPGKLFLCLGARLGSEVEALKDMGLAGHGIDLVPYKPHVLEGDFHNLKLEDGVLDIVYTNSIDHCYDLKGILTEGTRVLSPAGHFIIDVFPGNFSTHESIMIDTPEQIIEATPEALQLRYALDNAARLYNKECVQLVFQKIGDND
tara:strand:- start:565 stop:1206 length:642 start_codon:yes stop_codon:yes gene_type:complete